MRRGTTNSLVFNVNRDVTSARVYLTVVQDGKVIIDKSNDELQIESGSVTYRPTQTETLSFNVNRKAEAQLRFVFENGEADATEIYSFIPEDVLTDGELDYYPPDYKNIAFSISYLGENVVIPAGYFGRDRFVYISSEEQSKLLPENIKKRRESVRRNRDLRGWGLVG